MIMIKKVHIVLVFCFLYGCVEPFEAETQIFEDVLVIDARLNDEEKHHKVLLSRARPFEQDDSNAEQNATIKMKDDSGTEYSFEEQGPGTYVSTTPFSAQQNRGYQLLVTTVDGKSYVSETVRTPSPEIIDALYAKRETNGNGDEGVSILVNVLGSGKDIGYFRYEYEETYKIIAPFWDPFEFDIIDNEPCADFDIYEVGIKPRVVESRICYNTVSSTDVIQASTDALEENTISKFLVRFIDRDNFIMSHRYSIEVVQNRQTPEAYFYYQRLDSFSSSESIFSEIQPGFFIGNIESETDENEKVLGYFEVASVSRKRIYFNYSDLFPEEALPPYPINCETVGSPLLITPGFHCDGPNCDGACESPLISAIEAGLVVFHAENDDFTNVGEFIGPYLTKSAACGDCTKLGSNVKPDFWVE